MKGSFEFRVSNKRVMFHFIIRRNITVLQGNSATGKTTLLNMLAMYQRNGEASGISVIADGKFFVYINGFPGMKWDEVIGKLHNTVIFIEEDNDFVKTKEFAAYVRTSDNYFVLVLRKSLKMLPYSVKEIYELVVSQKYANFKGVVNEFRELYTGKRQISDIPAKQLVTEDKYSGYEFFQLFQTKKLCVSYTDGNAMAAYQIGKLQQSEVLYIVDGAAFGAYVEECIETIKNNPDKKVSIWMPESFEYLLLQSGIVKDANLKKVLENPSDYVESEKYESWEQFFTGLLISLTEGTPMQYSKSRLNEYFKSDTSIHKILQHFPAEVKTLLLQKKTREQE